MKCARCGKAVYAAELRNAEGQKWHHMCYQQHFKEKKLEQKKAVDEVSYNKEATVKPAYYRVADVDSGAPARLESTAGEVKATTPISAEPLPLAAPASGGAGSAGGKKFCTSCGMLLQAEWRFCGGCGAAV